MVTCLERGADLHMAQLMPLPLTVSCSNKIQIGFSFLVLAYLGSPGQRAIKLVCVCVCMCVCFVMSSCLQVRLEAACSSFTQLMMLGVVVVVTTQQQYFGEVPGN